MCELSEKWIAWLDRELPEDEAAKLERHLPLCPECRARVEAYRRASGLFNDYCHAHCEAIAVPRLRRRLPQWLPAVSGAAGVAAALAALLLLLPRAPIQPQAVRPPALAVRSGNDSQEVQSARVNRDVPPDPAPRAEVASVSHRSTGHMSAVRIKTAASSQVADANPFSAASAVEIAIPADAILPPGAAPAGIGFTADVVLAPDGSAQQIRLRPQLTGFERRSAQP